MENTNDERVNVLISLLKLMDNYIILKNDDTNILEDHSLVIAARFIANECFIDEHGQPNKNNIEKMKRAGFRVFAGESDSYGWLTGCIKIKQGIIVFG